MKFRDELEHNLYCTWASRDRIQALSPNTSHRSPTPTMKLLCHTVNLHGLEVGIGELRNHSFSS